MIGSTVFRKTFILTCALCLVISNAFALNLKLGAEPESNSFFVGDKVTLSAVSPNGDKVPDALRIVWYVYYKTKIKGRANSVWRYYIQDKRLQQGHSGDGKANQPFHYDTKGKIDFIFPEEGNFKIYCTYSYLENNRSKVIRLVRMFSAKRAPSLRLSSSPAQNMFLLGDKTTLSVIASDGSKAPEALRIVWTAFLPKRKNETNPRLISYIQDHRLPTGHAGSATAKHLFHFNSKDQIDFLFLERGEFSLLCTYSYMENNRSKTIILKKKFFCNGSLEGEIKYKNLSEVKRDPPQAGDNLILSVPYLIENVLQQKYFGIGFHRLPIDIKAVKRWNWSAKAGSFDKRKSLEGSLPENSIIWNTPEVPGWYDVECGVDVFGDGCLMATLTTKICVAQKQVEPPRQPMKILAPNPIAGELTVPPTITFSQVFVASTELNATETTFIWEASPGIITGDGKTATWIYSCDQSSAPKTVKIGCTAICSGKTLDKGEKIFDLSLPNFPTTPNSAASELEQEISAALLELYGVNWKDLEHLMNIYNPIINANITVKGKTPIDTLVLALKQLYGDRWWKYLPIYPRSNNPEDLDHFSKVYPVEATIAVMKSHFNIELEGGIASNGIPDAEHLWTPQQAFFAYWAVQQVPPFVSKYTKYIKRVTRLPAYPSANGYVIRGEPRIHICNLGCYAGYFEKVLIHEMGHIWMFDPENQAVAREFMDTFRQVDGKIVGTLVSGYAGTNIYEDFAESFAYFWKDPVAMKKVSPLRFEFMLKKVFTYYTPNLPGHNIIKSKGTTLSPGFTSN